MPVAASFSTLPWLRLAGRDTSRKLEARQLPGKVHFGTPSPAKSDSAASLTPPSIKRRRRLSFPSQTPDRSPGTAASDSRDGLGGAWPGLATGPGAEVQAWCSAEPMNINNLAAKAQLPRHGSARSGLESLTVKNTERYTKSEFSVPTISPGLRPITGPGWDLLRRIQYSESNFPRRINDYSEGNSSSRYSNKDNFLQLLCPLAF
eukprot:g49281.t1